jgi:hypothetical protein
MNNGIRRKATFAPAGVRSGRCPDDGTDLIWHERLLSGAELTFECPREFAGQCRLMDIALYENASIISVDARGSRLRVQVGNARPPSVALSDLPRGEHRSSAVPRAASTSMQLFDSRRAPAFDVE